MNGNIKTDTIVWQQRFQKKKAFDLWYEENSYLLHSPASLLGDEMNSIHFDWEKAYQDGDLDDHFKVALVDVSYSVVSTASVAIRLFYQELHEYDPRWIVERFLCPATQNNDRMLKENGFAFLSLEGRMPLEAFDVICCSQQMIGDELNLIAMLLDSGIPVRSHERSEEDPIIIRGGASSFNPSVIMDVCDLFFMGEGEEILAELISLIQAGRNEGLKKEDILLKAVQKWDCLWAPCFYEQQFDEAGNLKGMAALRDDVPGTIRYNYVRDLDNCFALTKPVGNYCFPSSLTLGTDITRGCEGHCGFCVSGFTYAPFRVRSVDRVVKLAKAHILNTGTERVRLSSFSAMSYPYLNELERRIHEEVCSPDMSLSLRLDSVHENPELCNLIRRQGKRRIVFGVEGISQRLRQRTSKNCSEEQILDTVRMLCQSGYEKVKLMFISGLYGENDDDRQELIELTEKIMKICKEETPEGIDPPLVHYSWTPLKLYPFTPFQWFAARPTVDPLPEDVRNRLLEMGVILTDDQQEGEIYDLILTQLLLRGDSRFEDMLIEMATTGIRRYSHFDSNAKEFVDNWIKEHDLPGYEVWFGAKDKDTVLPWDFIDTGVSRDHLWKRYLSAASDEPKDFPRCLDKCQGCGACDKERHQNMETYRKALKLDRRIKLSNINPDAPEAEAEDRTLKYALLSYTVGEKYRSVIRSYWMDELRRTFDLAGIRFDRGKVKIYKPYLERADWADGLKMAVAAIREEISDEELLGRLNATSLHMTFTAVKWMDHFPVAKTASYRIPCPEGTDEAALAERIRTVMESDSWQIRIEYIRQCVQKLTTADVREQIHSLELKDHALLMTINVALPHYAIYQNLLDLPWEVAGRYHAVCTAIELE